MVRNEAYFRGLKAGVDLARRWVVAAGVSPTPARISYPHGGGAGVAGTGRASRGPVREAAPSGAADGHSCMSADRVPMRAG